MSKLAVNIDHVATLREARKTFEPEPAAAAIIVEQAGADGLVMHLRQDRRHIQERDLRITKEIVHIPINLEMAATEGLKTIAMNVQPSTVTLVPERMEEISTEGGLNLTSAFPYLEQFIADLKSRIDDVSLFIDPHREQIELAKKLKATSVELNTSLFSAASSETVQKGELLKIRNAAAYANELDLKIRAGHGLNYVNVKSIARIPCIFEFSIGHSIISKAVFTGLYNAIKEMASLIKD